MFLTKEKEVCRTEHAVVGVRCDFCGKEIEISKPYFLHPYFSITTGHRDWGNDSGESIKNKDACSEKCLKFAMEEYYKVDSNSKYIEIEATMFFIDKNGVMQ